MQVDERSTRKLTPRPASPLNYSLNDDNDSLSPSPITRRSESPAVRQSPKRVPNSLANQRPSSPDKSGSSSHVQRRSRTPSPTIRKSPSSSKRGPSAPTKCKDSRISSPADTKPRKKATLNVDQELQQTDERIAKKIKELEILEGKCKLGKSVDKGPTPNLERKDKEKKIKVVRKVTVIRKSESGEQDPDEIAGSESIDTASSSLRPLLESKWTRRQRSRSWSEDSCGTPKPGSRKILLQLN